MNTFCQSPVMINTERKNANVANERQISLDIMAEKIKVFTGLTLQSKINNSTYYNSEEDVSESDPKSNPLVATNISDGNERKITDTDTIKGNSSHKLLTNREITAIIQGIIPPVNQTTSDGVETSGKALHAVRAVLDKEIVTSATCSTASVLKDPPVVNWKVTGKIIPFDKNNVGIPPHNH